MQRLSVLFSAVLLSLAGVTAGAQQSATVTRQPVSVPPGFFASLNAAPKHMVTNRLSASTNLAAQAQDPRIVSIPHFTRSFNYEGQSFAFTMAGRAPATNQATTIPTIYVPLSLYFDEYVDQNGNNITIDATTITNEVRRSPLFDNAEYATGRTQFVDAQMRAEFWQQVNRGGSENFHVLLGSPQTLTPVTIEVPVGSAVVYQLPDGTYFAEIDYNFLISQLNTLLQTEPVTVDSIPIFLTRNAVYGDFVSQQPVDCCIGGLHTAYEASQTRNRVLVQTAAFATSLDADVADGIFGDAGEFADINALSHELAETLNDPFADNVTPYYQMPGEDPGVCGNYLEVGDVIEGLQPDYTDVALHGFNYHPQTLGLLQWFEGQQPSNAIEGSYSFPDTTKLTEPFEPCGPVPIG